MTRRIARCPAGDAPPRGRAVGAAIPEAAKRKPAALYVPLWTIR